MRCCGCELAQGPVQHRSAQNFRVGWLVARLLALLGLDGSERGKGPVPWLWLLLWGVGITAALRQVLPSLS